MVHIISRVSLLVLFGEDSVESFIYRCSLSFWNLLTLFNCYYGVSGVYLSCEKKTTTLRWFTGYQLWKTVAFVENEKEIKIRIYPSKFVVTIMHLQHDKIDNNFLGMDVQIKENVQNYFWIAHLANCASHPLFFCHIWSFLCQKDMIIFSRKNYTLDGSSM